MRNNLVLITISLLVSFNIWPQALGRRPNLGVSLRPLTTEIAKELGYEGDSKLYVQKIIPNSTASSIGIEPNDIIVDYAGVSIGPGFYNQIKSNYREGDKITATVIRKGKKKKLSGKAIGTKREETKVADVIYDHVDYDGGKLRSIIWKPKNTSKEKLPVIFYVQGFSCSSIEQIGPKENSAVKQLLEGFAEKGYTVYRVEKLGLGDSMNEEHCKDIDVVTEIDGFKAALSKLTQYSFVDKDQIIIWGHSLGAQQAPFIAEGSKVKAIVGFGYVAKSWHDYIIDIITVQLPMLVDANYGDMQEKMNDFRMPLYDLLYNKVSISGLKSKYPKEDIESLLNIMESNGKTLFGRHQKFLQSINDLNLLKKHQEIKIPTLALYGSSDIAAIGGDDGVRVIADAINQVAPGNGHFKIIEDTNHQLSKVGNMQDNIEVHRAKKAAQDAMLNYNPDIVEITHEWIQSISN